MDHRPHPAGSAGRRPSGRRHPERGSRHDHGHRCWWRRPTSASTTRPRHPGWIHA